MSKKKAINWKTITTSIVTEICPSKFNLAFSEGAQSEHVATRTEVFRILQLYLQYVGQELGLIPTKTPRKEDC